MCGSWGGGFGLWSKENATALCCIEGGLGDCKGGQGVELLLRIF